MTSYPTPTDSDVGFCADADHEADAIVITIHHGPLATHLVLDMDAADDLSNTIRMAMASLALGPNPDQPTLDGWNPGEPF